MECLRFSLAWARMEMPVILIWVNLLQQDGMPLHHSPITLCKTLRKRTWCQARDRQANCGQPRNLQHKQHHAAPDPKPNSSHCLQHALNTLVQSWQEITIRLLQCPARTPNQANPELKGISHSTMFSHPRWSLGLLKIQLQRNAQLKVQKPVKNWTLLAMLLETLRCPHLFTEQSRDVNAPFICGWVHILWLCFLMTVVNTWWKSCWKRWKALSTLGLSSPAAGYHPLGTRVG